MWPYKVINNCECQQLDLKQKDVKEKDIPKHNLLWPSMTFGVMGNILTNLTLIKVSNHNKKKNRLGTKKSKIRVIIEHKSDLMWP